MVNGRRVFLLHSLFATHHSPVLLQLRPLPAWWLLQGDKTRSHPELGRQTPPRQWYFVSRHGRVGRRQARQERSLPLCNPSDLSKGQVGNRQSAIGSRQTLSSRLPFAHPRLPASPDAGWSSPVARQAHNLKVTGSNPVPATKHTKSPVIK